MTKQLRQKFKNCDNEKRFLREIKNIFHHFRGLLVTKICLTSGFTPLIYIT